MTDFSTRRPSFDKHFTGLALVVVCHVVVIYALTLALSKKDVDVIRQPIEARIIATTQAPSPPRQLLRPALSFETPPAPYIAPPEVVLSPPKPAPAPKVVAPATPTESPKPATRHVAPRLPLAPPANKPVVSLGQICTVMVKPIMPRRAVLAGTGGTVKARATIRGGKVIEVQILRSRPRGVFDSAVRSAMMQYKCVGDHIVEQEFAFKLD
jgi:protein TonB